MAAKDNDDAKPETQEDAHSLDMSQAAVKKMISEAREKGYITYDQLNQVLPPDQVSSDQIEDVMSMLSEMGIQVTEEEETEEDNASKGGTELVDASKGKDVALSSGGSEKLDRTDDPVRMYLREMGSVELLSREGEIAIAKRIEAGRNTMILGLCESPLTFQAITIWREELLSEDILLRDVIDLETTFSGQMDEDGDIAEPVVDPAAAPSEKPKKDEPELDADGNPIARDDDEDDEEQANMSLAAMEAALKPRVLETLDRIASDYEALVYLRWDYEDMVIKDSSKDVSGRTHATLKYLGRTIFGAIVRGKHITQRDVEEVLYSFPETILKPWQFIRSSKDLFKEEDKLRIRAVYDPNLTKDPEELRQRIAKALEEKLSVPTEVEWIPEEEVRTLPHKVYKLYVRSS